MLCGTMLGKSPLVSPSFANLPIDESLEAVPNANPTAQEKFFIHYFTSQPSNSRYGEKFSGFESRLLKLHKYIAFTSASGCPHLWGRRRLSKQSDQLRPAPRQTDFVTLSVDHCTATEAD
jgi:hypothetical protein